MWLHGSIATGMAWYGAVMTWCHGIAHCYWNNAVSCHTLWWSWSAPCLKYMHCCCAWQRTTWQLQDVVFECRWWLASLKESAWSACFFWMLSVMHLHRLRSCASKLFNAAQFFPNGSEKNWALPSCCMVALMLSNLCRSHGRHQCYLAALWQSSIFFWTIPEKVSSVEKLRCTVVHCTQLVLFISAYDAQATMCKTLSPPTILYV